MDCEDEAGLAEGALAPLKSPLVNARTGLPTNLGQVLEEMDVGQHKCLHLVLLRFFGWGLHWIFKVCIAGGPGCHWQFFRGPWRQHIASLEASLGEVTKAGARVVVVSFGSPQVCWASTCPHFKPPSWDQGAACWLNETGCKLEMFLDQERSLYRAFGLARSLSKVNKESIRLTCLLIKHWKNMVKGKSIARNWRSSNVYFRCGVCQWSMSMLKRWSDVKVARKKMDILHSFETKGFLSKFDF